MQTKITLKSLPVIICLLLQFHLQAQVTIHVETAGTLPSLIAEAEKYQITELILTGDLNGTDIKYIREMAGSDVEGHLTKNGKLAILNLADANIVSGGDAYYVYSSSAYYSTENNSISAAMFYFCEKLTSVTLPSSVTSIGDYAFATCYGLTSITIPDGVTSIGYYAFQGCIQLTSITLPNSVTSIGDSAFQSCGSLTSIALPNDVTSIGGSTFMGCSYLTSITLPNSLISIGYSAFAGCTRLTSIILPNSVTSIGDYVFINCESFTSVSLPEGVISIGEGAFSSCYKLTSISLPNSLTGIGNYAFGGCSLLATIHSKMITPSSITSNVFDSRVDKPTCILYIPQGSLDAYLQAPVWQEFNIIEETVTVFVPETGGILPVLSIHSVSGGIAIETKEAIPVAVYNIFGQKIYESLINGSREINLNKGIYVVKAKKESQKVIVK